MHFKQHTHKTKMISIVIIALKAAPRFDADKKNLNKILIERQAHKLCTNHMNGFYMPAVCLCVCVCYHALLLMSFDHKA